MKIQRKRVLIFIVWAALLCGPLFASTGPGRDVGVLFIGNSYTYFNDGIDHYLIKLVRSDVTQGGVRSKSVAEASATLAKLWSDGKALKKIRTGEWGFVVLQEQSSGPLRNPQAMKQYVAEFDREIRKAGAQTILFMTWPYHTAFITKNKFDAEVTMERMLAVNVSVCEEIAKEFELKIAPVGLAWQKAIELDPKINLYDSDGSHPNVDGTYLTACVFYSLIYQKSPVGLDQCKLSNGTFYQKVAWETVKEYYLGGTFIGVKESTFTLASSPVSGKPVPKLKPIAVDPAKLKRLAGRYTAGGQARIITFDGEKLYSHWEGEDIHMLVPLSETEFGFEDIETRLRFELAGDKVIGVYRRLAVDDLEEPIQKRVEPLKDKNPKVTALVQQCIC